ncbi:MAG: hypothetical protein IPK85_06630 [Gemmatimonadetes bacterium]|nr:hypothetical protein [Gemmatimonadota bacterium]
MNAMNGARANTTTLPNDTAALAPERRTIAQKSATLTPPSAGPTSHGLRATPRAPATTVPGGNWAYHFPSESSTCNALENSGKAGASR